LETDGACAVVLTTTERARDMPQPVVVLSGWAWAIGPNGFWAGASHLDQTAGALVAPRLYSMAGVGPRDIDVAELYDAFSISVLLQLEDYGFCAKGESGPLVSSGATARGGALPVNTHGGFLSEGYVHGLNHLCEAVEQLRGVAGPRQVPSCEVALSTSQPGYISGMSSAAILRRL
jgi:acetyl-CoA acetyltransferase